MTDEQLMGELDNEVRKSIDELLPFNPDREMQDETEIEEAVEAESSVSEQEIEPLLEGFGADAELSDDIFDLELEGIGDG